MKPLDRYRFFERRGRLSLLLPAIILATLWFFSGNPVLSQEEFDLWRKVKTGQERLFSWREAAGTLASPDDSGADPWRTGLIGIEWSPITTTLGPVEAKRTAADPLWSVYTLRRFRDTGLRKGDRVVLLSSSSFPGLVFSILAAVEHYGLDLVWIHSLGSSTWGANRPDLPWPRIASFLRKEGFISARPEWYTLGGVNETALDMSPEGREILTLAAEEDKAPLLDADNLDTMISMKTGIVRSAAPRLVILIGGSHSTFGGREIVPPGGGLYDRTDLGRIDAGDGVFRKVLEDGIPVLHFLSMRSLSSAAGIPYDGRPLPRFRGGAGNLASAAGLAFFFLFLICFRRWARDGQ